MLKYHKIEIQVEDNPTCSTLLIYTGGTIGMCWDVQQKCLIPFDFEQFVEHVPELSYMGTNITVFAFEELLDSANITPEHWIGIAEIIEEHYEQYDGFLILHGTDTMAYSASALSFLMENLAKPIIFTGAQLPIGVTRNDAKENLLTALEILVEQSQEKNINEVCIYFHDVLLRGNRAKKVQSSYFDAFESDNYPLLAKAGISIDYHKNVLMNKPTLPFICHKKMDANVAILKLFPGITKEVVESILNIVNLKAIVLETFGAGNTMTSNWFLQTIEKALEKGIIIYNVSQCAGGKVLQGHYETSIFLEKKGVINGEDITTEAAITKMMFVLANISKKHQKKYLKIGIRGELTNS